MCFFERYDLLAKRNKTNVNAVAKKLNLSSGSLTAWKNGAVPNANSVKKIADFFGTTTDYLLGLSDHSQPINDLMEAVKNLNDQETEKVKDYILFVKSQRKQEL
ncbi:MAG: helix-turn-helix domain-containing protein [Firmicutes bacterium]|nr:helix-turn-helix domain-containing protein [Bacillota bacterium]